MERALIGEFKLSTIEALCLGGECGREETDRLHTAARLDVEEQDDTSQRLEKSSHSPINSQQKGKREIKIQQHYNNSRGFIYLPPFFLESEFVLRKMEMVAIMASYHKFLVELKWQISHEVLSLDKITTIIHEMNDNNMETSSK